MAAGRSKSRAERVKHLPELREALSQGYSEVVFPEWLFKRENWRDSYEVTSDPGLGGAQGVIRFGVSRETGQDVAIKTIRPGVSGEERAIAERDLRWEAAILTLIALEEANRFSLYAMDVFDHDGSVVLVMPQLSPLSEDRRKRESSQEEREFGVAADFRDVLLAVHDLHKIGLVHLDLKPSNLLCAANGSIMVADFGLARLAVGPHEIGPDDVVEGYPRDMSRGFSGTLPTVEEMELDDGLGGGGVEVEGGGGSSGLVGDDSWRESEGSEGRWDDLERLGSEDGGKGSLRTSSTRGRSGVFSSRLRASRSVSTPTSETPGSDGSRSDPLGEALRGRRLKVACYHSPTNRSPGFSPGFRAPELCDPSRPYFSPQQDAFALGVSLAKMLSKFPSSCSATNDGRFLFPEDWDNFSIEVQDLIKGLVDPDPDKRLAVAEAMQHPWICYRTDAAGRSVDTVADEIHRRISFTTPDGSKESVQPDCSEGFWLAVLEQFMRLRAARRRSQEHDSPEEGLNKAEFLALMREWKLDKVGIPLEGLFHAIDDDHSDSIELNELQEGLRTLVSPDRPEERARLVFRMYAHADPKGRLSKTGIHRVLSKSFSSFVQDTIFKRTVKQLCDKLEHAGGEEESVLEEDFIAIVKEDPHFLSLFLSPGQAAQQRLEAEGTLRNILAHPVAIFQEVFLVWPRGIYLFFVLFASFAVLFHLMGMDFLLTPFDSFVFQFLRLFEDTMHDLADSKGVVDEGGTMDE